MSGASPKANSEVKSTFPVGSRCVWTADCGQVITGDHWPVVASSLAAGGGGSTAAGGASGSASWSAISAGTLQRIVAIAAAAAKRSWSADRAGRGQEEVATLLCM